MANDHKSRKECHKEDQPYSNGHSIERFEDVVNKRDVLFKESSVFDDSVRRSVPLKNKGVFDPRTCCGHAKKLQMNFVRNENDQ